MLNGKRESWQSLKIRTKKKMTEIDFSDFLTQVKICLLNKNEEQKSLKRRKEFPQDFLKNEAVI